MMTLQKTVEIPADHRLFLELNIPQEIPAGKADVQFIFAPLQEAEPEQPLALDPRLKGAVNPEIYGKGKVCGDIIGPFHDVWENGY